MNLASLKQVVKEYEYIHNQRYPKGLSNKKKIANDYFLFL
jgi:hypothetical protein